MNFRIVKERWYHRCLDFLFPVTKETNTVIITAAMDKNGRSKPIKCDLIKFIEHKRFDVIDTPIDVSSRFSVINEDFVNISSLYRESCFRPLGLTQIKGQTLFFRDLIGGNKYYLDLDEHKSALEKLT